MEEKIFFELSHIIYFTTKCTTSPYKGTENKNGSKIEPLTCGRRHRKNNLIHICALHTSLDFLCFTGFSLSLCLSLSLTHLCVPVSECVSLSLSSHPHFTLYHLPLLPSKCWGYERVSFLDSAQKRPVVMRKLIGKATSLENREVCKGTRGGARAKWHHIGARVEGR